MNEIDRRLTISIALTAVAVAIGVSWFTNRPEPVVTPSMAQVEAEARRGGYRLIDVYQLKQLVAARPEDTRLIDTRQEWEYRKGHIQNALHFPMESTWWAMWRKKNSLATLLGSDRSKTFVFY